MTQVVREATAQELDAAIAAMVRTFEQSRTWSAFFRYEVCRAVFQGVSARAEEFACTIAHEARKPIRTARGEVARALTTFRLAMEESTRIAGEQLPVDIDDRSQGYHAVVERFPIGPCALVSGFNFPLNIVAHKVAPALAVGCPFILKPSERTPRTALLLGEVLAGVGLPEGFWHVLPCDRTVARQLVTDDRIRLLSFTGSPEVGWKMKAEAGKKAVILELGNDSAVVVEPETDLGDAIPRIVTAAFGYAGQSCISVQRIYLHRAIAEQATAALVERTKRLILGDPLDEATDVGPLIDEAAAVRIEAWIRDSGGEVLVGGHRRGDFIEPTLVRNPRPGTNLACQEVFGPVATVEVYDDFDDVLRRVNATRYGLQAGIFTRDIHKIRKAFLTLDVGGLVINDVPTMRVDNMPYGGVKDSGLGREGVKYAIEHMTERKVLLTRFAGTGWQVRS